MYKIKIKKETAKESQLEAGQKSLCHPDRRNPWGRHRGALPMPLVGHRQFQTEQAHLVSLLEGFKEAASHEAELTNEN